MSWANKFARLSARVVPMGIAGAATTLAQTTVSEGAANPMLAAEEPTSEDPVVP
jgi:hypothetical protein